LRAVKLRHAIAAALVAALGCAPSALAQQGGAPAPDFSDPCPALYPGDGAGAERIARWMARGAGERGMPLELPVMAGLAESGLQNLRGKSYHGFFGMHSSLNTGDYRGFPKNPVLQLDWFLDTAALVRQRRVAEGRPDPAADPGAYGLWIADVERPAPQNRSGYQPHLEKAGRLVGTECPAPVRSDVTAPALRVRVARRQRALASDGIVTRLRCPAEACMAGVVATLTAGDRELTLRAPAIDPASTWSSVLIRLPRAARRQLARGRRLAAKVTVSAADAAANPARAERSTLLIP
jgi:hypothetical protein